MDDSRPAEVDEPQTILTPITEAAIFLTLTLDRGAEEAVRGLLSDVSGLRRSVGFRIPEAALTCIAGIGADAWDRLFGAPRPAGLHPFRELSGPRHSAPRRGATSSSTFARTASTCASSSPSCSWGGYTRTRAWSTRCTGSDRSTSATCSASSTEPRIRRGPAAGANVLIGGEDAPFAGGSYWHETAR